MNFSVCITVYGTLDTTLASRGHRNLLFRMRTCTLEPPDYLTCNCEAASWVSKNLYSFKKKSLKSKNEFRRPTQFVCQRLIGSQLWKSYFTITCRPAGMSGRCGSRIWSRGGPQLLRPKVADIAKRSRASEASILWPGSRARLRALEAFGFLMLKYAFSHILATLFLLFLTSILTPKVDKNRALDFTSINLRHSDMLHLFFNLHEKVML